MPGDLLAGQWRGVTLRIFGAARQGRRLLQLRAALTVAVALVLQVAVLGAAVPASQAHDGDHPVDFAAVLKPALRGLVVTQPRSLATVPYAEFGSLRLPWNSIEKAPGVFDFSSIDTVLASHHDVRFRLRIMAGIHAPQWVKEASGGCVLIEPNSPNGNTGCAPRFWTDAFHGHYVNLMEAVAARYEDDQQVVEVANSECTTIYSEPFILGADSASIDRLWAAKYTKSGHETCLRRSTEAMMDLFDTTRISIAGHTRWQYIVQTPWNPADGMYAASWEDERTLLNELTNAYGTRIVLEDHGLGPDDPVCPTPGESRETATSWYCYMSGLHDSPAAYGWQFTLNGGSMETAADAGVGMGACYLEFAAFQSLDETKRRTVHDQLLTNCEDAGQAPVVDNQTQPAISGKPEVGETLTATPGAWSPEPDDVSYQWLRNGRPVAAATASTYRPSRGDAGRRITVRVTAHHEGYLAGQATTDVLRVPKITTSTRSRLPKARTHARRPKIVIVVTSAVGAPRGRVVVTSGGRRVGSGRLHDGRVRVRLHRMSPGGHWLVARFPATDTMRASRATPVRVVIKR